jgi:hypothetical protein
MDPITAAIVAALAAGAISGVTKVTEQAISESYGKLKELLGKKFGAKSKVIKAVKELEVNPKSEPRKGVLREEVAVSKADQDADLLMAAQNLLKAIKAKPGGEQIVQMAMGDQNIQIAGDGNTVNMNTPKSKR